MERFAMDDKVEKVLAQDLGEGYRIVRDSGELSPMIEWVDWITDPDTDETIEVAVHFEDGSEETLAAGTQVRQIWHGDVD